MNRDRLMSRILVAAAGFNLVAACMLGFPASPAGQLAGLPAAVPVPYRAILALLIVLFATAYLWLAARPSPDRPLVAFFAIGKASVFVLVLVLWIMQQVPLASLVTSLGDLGFAAAFAWWLAG